MVNVSDAGVIRDFLLKLGFDASEVTSGLKAVEKKLKAVSKTKDASYRESAQKEIKSESKRLQETLKKMKEADAERAKYRYKGYVLGNHHELKLKADQLVKEEKLISDAEESRYQKSLKRMSDVDEKRHKMEHDTWNRYSKKKRAEELKVSADEQSRLNKWFENREKEDAKSLKETKDVEKRRLNLRKEASKTFYDTERARLDRWFDDRSKADKAALEEAKLNEKRRAAAKLAADRERIKSEREVAKASKKTQNGYELSDARTKLVNSLGITKSEQLSKAKYAGLDSNLRSKIKSDYDGLISRAEAAKDIREIKAIKEEYRLLNSEINQARIGQTRLNNQISVSRRIGSRLGGIAPSAFGGGMMGGMAGGAAMAAMRNPITALIASGTILAAVMSKVAMKMEAVRLTLVAASGSAVQAGEDFTYIKEVALKYGVGLEEAARGYAKISVAARTAGLSIEQTRELFLAGTEASVAFGLSSEEVGGIFKAFSDMLSKGTVNAEEIKGQLGDRLPIALAVAAKVTGTTTQQFMKMMEQGQIIATDFLPKFAGGLRGVANEGDGVNKALGTANREMGRLGAAWEIAMSDMAQAGADEGLADLFGSVKAFILDNKDVFIFLGKTLGGIYSFIARIIDIVNILFRILMLPVRLFANMFKTTEIDEFGNEVSKLSDGLNPFIRGWDIVIGSIEYAIGMTIRFLNLLESINPITFGSNLGGAAHNAIRGVFGLDPLPLASGNSTSSTANKSVSQAAVSAYDNMGTSRPVINNIKVESKPDIKINGGNPHEIKTQIESMFQNEYIAGMYYGGGA